MSIPTKWNRVQVRERVTDSHKALEVNQIDSSAPEKNQVTIKVAYVGINATDLNTFLGVYGAPATGNFDVGLEAVGTVVAVGADVTAYKVDDAILIQGFGCWYDYKNVALEEVICKVPAAEAKYLTIPISLLTAAISVGEQSEAKAGDVALVTSAAGGFGQFTVQFLKQRGATVVATCSSDAKAEFLKSLGADRIIDYKKENLGEVLKKEYPAGVNVVYETIGGEIFEQCLANLANFARMIIIGSISGYKAQKAFAPTAESQPTPAALLNKSASMKGFFLPHWASFAGKYIADAIPKILSGELVVKIDDVKTFQGLGQVADAVEHLHSGASFGKVVVKI